MTRSLASDGEPSIPDEDHVSRYCKPTAMAQSGLPMAASFRLREGEEYLSVNWLEYLRQPDLPTALDLVRDSFRQKGFRLARNGRFSVLRVAAIKTAAAEAAGRQLLLQHRPSPLDQSHAGIFGYAAEDLAIAAELAAIVTPRDIHPARTGLTNSAP